MLQDTTATASPFADSPFYLGRALTRNPPEQLQPLPVAQLHHLLTRDPALARQVQELRQVRTLDTRAYGHLKLQLPYFVGATFSQAQRHQRNFLRMGALVLDFDHLPAAGHTPEALREQVRTDARVWLAFVSPSGEGLKVVLGLARPEHDAARYRAFYRAFAASFAARHGLSDCLDGVTHDVSRVCLLSHDPAAYFNPAPALLEPEQEVDFDSLVLEAGFQRLAKTDTPGALPWNEEALAGQGSAADLPTAPPRSVPLDELLRRLNPGRRPERMVPDPVQPTQLAGLADEVAAAAAGAGLHLGAVTPISYGQCYRFELGRQFGEVNVFYGKRGYTLVKTTKSGSEPRLAEAGRVLLEGLLFGGEARSAATTAPADDQAPAVPPALAAPAPAGAHEWGFSPVA